jgi:hypothetical protein
MTDEIIALNENDLKIFTTVDDIMEKAILSGNPLMATELANDLIRSGQVRGLALAKLFWEVSTNWDKFQAAGIDDDWVSFMNVNTGRSRQTITKYAAMWNNIFQNPEITSEFKRQLMNKDIKSLLLLTAYAREGFDEKTIEKIVEAADSESVREVVRGERGDATSSKTALKIYYQIREGSKQVPGTLFIRDNKGVPVIIGTLFIDSGYSDIEKAINRILNSAHIMEVV